MWDRVKNEKRCTDPNCKLFHEPKYDVVYTCDKCNTTNLPNVSVIRVANIMAIEVCEQCARELLDMIRATMSPQARIWYNALAEESRRSSTPITKVEA